MGASGVFAGRVFAYGVAASGETASFQRWKKP